MKIENVKTYGLEESVVASGYPMKNESLNECGFDYAVSKIQELEEIPERATKLGSSKSGEGHDCFLKGITVQADLTCSQAMHMQFLRYHFVDIVSSQSKMHRLLKMDIRKQCNKYVNKLVIEHLDLLVERYNKSGSKEDYLKVIYNCPIGLELTFRFTTNYLQLKTIYNQRHNHRLPEWREFCNWILTLPHFNELTKIGGNI